MKLNKQSKKVGKDSTSFIIHKDECLLRGIVRGKFYRFTLELVEVKKE